MSAVYPTPPEVGKTYDLRHSRLGRATVRIIAINGEWIETEIVAGVLAGHSDSWHPGERKTVRDSHCWFYPKEGTR